MIYLYLVVALAFAGLYAHDFYEQTRAKSAVADLKTSQAETKSVRADLTSAVATNSQFKATLDDQQRAIAALKALEDLRRKQAIAAQAAASQANAKLKARENEIAGTAPTSDDKCKAACSQLRSPL